ATVSAACSEACWSWTPRTWRTRLRSRCGSRPSTRTLPPSGRRSPATSSTVVVLPAPLTPSTPTTSPCSMRRLTSSTAVVLPYRLRSRVATTAGGLVSGVLMATTLCGRHGPAPVPMVRYPQHDFRHLPSGARDRTVVDMRRLTTDEWSGLAMLAVSVGVGAPALFGAVDLAIPRAAWTLLFGLLILALLVAIMLEKGRARYAVFGIGVVTAWAVVLTAPQLGLLPILLVVVAALSVYVVPLRFGFVVAGLSTAVIAAAMVRADRDPLDTLVTVGFYLLIQVATMLSSATLIREQRLRQELTRAHVDLRAATVLLAESARTAERLRISRDLHDQLGHQLTVLTLELEAARHREGEQ